MTVIDYGSATDNLGAHLLGRRPSPPDPRDWQLSEFLALADPLDQALLALQKSHAAASTKAFATVLVPRIHALESAVNLTPPAPPPAPTPPPAPAPGPAPDPAPTAAKLWPDTEAVLDQGNTSHCVGFGGSQYGNTDPVDDKYGNPDGHKLYYECKVIDGEPGAEDGSDVRTLAKALVARARIGAYAFAATVEEAAAYVLSNGPVVMGTDWTNDMFNPDATGLVKPTGGIAGGHCYLLIGYDPVAEILEYLNSWGSSWSLNGRFRMTLADAKTLFKDGGEALATLELPLPA